jgi:hypothetical protein
MSTGEIIGLVVLGVAAIVIVVAVAARLVLHLLMKPLEARIAARYAEHEVLLKDLGANSFGLESKGVFQLRGNGALVLTASHLHFFQFLPKREVCIPLVAITAIDFTHTHLGKATTRDLLKVRFEDGGKADSIAWYLSDTQAWKERIEDARAARPAG